MFAVGASGGVSIGLGGLLRVLLGGAGVRDVASVVGQFGFGGAAGVLVDRGGEPWPARAVIGPAAWAAADVPADDRLPGLFECGEVTPRRRDAVVVDAERPGPVTEGVGGAGRGRVCGRPSRLQVGGDLTGS